MTVRMPFGKFKGRPIASIPKWYLKWLEREKILKDGGLKDAIHEKLAEWEAARTEQPKKGRYNRRTKEAAKTDSAPCSHRDVSGELVVKNGSMWIKERCKDCKRFLGYKDLSESTRDMEVRRRAGEFVNGWRYWDYETMGPIPWPPEVQQMIAAGIKEEPPFDVEDYQI